ncbi:MAG: DUF3566 domain-containing protein [Aeromicrobium sp.]
MSKPDDHPPGSPQRPGEPRRQQIPRPRDIPTPPPSETPVRKSVQPKKASNSGGPPPKGKPHVVDPIDAARKDAPPSAADYGRTTKGSPATTAVIPPVKDQPRSAKPKTTSAQPQRTPSPAAQAGRRASLRLVHVEPWSVTRLAFVVSVAMMIVAVVAVSIFWLVLSVTGVWGQINDSVTSVLSDDGGTFDIKDYLGFGRLFGLTLVLSAINVVLMTALATIGAHLYNLAAQLLGGLEVTFSDD